MVKEKKKVVKKNDYKTLKELYYSGKVKPTLNKIIVELENDTENIEMYLLACQCLARTKNYDILSTYADTIIKLSPENAEGYYFKGVAFKHIKGKEQEAIKNFNEALVLDPENTVYLKDKAVTHLLLFTDYDLPIKFADKHKEKAQESLMKVIELIENKEDADYIDYLTIADTHVLISKAIRAKKYYINAVSSFEESEEFVKDMNIYKDIIKAQKACIKEVNKFTEF